MNLFDWTENVAVVLGATGVLGGAIAEGLAVASARVAVLGRNAGRGEARVRYIQKQGGTAGFFPADALDQSSLSAAREAEPDLDQVIEAFIPGNLGRRDVAMIIEKRQGLSELEVELFACGSRAENSQRERALPWFNTGDR